MKYILLAYYSGSKLAENIAFDSKLSAIFNINNLVIFLVVMIIVLTISIFVFLILPEINKTPKKYYQRYLKVREELEKIDKLYARRKLSFENYAFTQFHYAKEYEHLIDYLSQFPEYKDKLKSYKLNHLKTNTKTERLSEEEKKNAEIINYFIRVLAPVAVYYRKNEVYQAILDEDFSKTIADGIINGLEKLEVKFNSKVLSENRKGIDLVDELIYKKQDKNKQKKQEKTYEMPNVMDQSKYLSMKAKQEKDNATDTKTPDIEKPKETPKAEILEPQPKEIPDDFFKSTADSKVGAEPTNIALKDLIKKQPQNLNFENTVTYSKFSEKSQPSIEPPPAKKGLLSSIKNVFKSKKNTHSVSEINDIFDNIDKKLK